jgi:hypothetical protein
MLNNIFLPFFCPAVKKSLAFSKKLYRQIMYKYQVVIGQKRVVGSQVWCSFLSQYKSGGGKIVSSPRST